MQSAHHITTEMIKLSMTATLYITSYERHSISSSIHSTALHKTSTLVRCQNFGKRKTSENQAGQGVDLDPEKNPTA